MSLTKLDHDISKKDVKIIFSDRLRIFVIVSQNHKNHFLRSVTPLLKSPPEKIVDAKRGQ